MPSYNSPDANERLWYAAVAGDTDAFGNLLFRLHHQGDKIAITLQLSRHLDFLVGPAKRRKLGPVLMAALVNLWEHDCMSPLMRRLGWSRAAFVHLCDLAGGPDVADLPDRVRVYRGGGGGRRQVARGMSWTRDAEIARFFADRQVTILGSCTVPRKGPRCMIAADVPREAIVFRSDNREEAEVILRHAPRKFEIVYQGDLEAAA